MNFTLHEIRLWFFLEHAAPKSFLFLPNKVNVIRGDATTGKSSFLSIIDYCLLASKINIANTIVEKVKWFGIRFSINDKEISIIRKSPYNGAPSSDVYFDFGKFPERPGRNSELKEIKSFLDQEFRVSIEAKFPIEKNINKTAINVSFRHFLIFSSLTENIIGSAETYFDTAFFGKEEFDTILRHLFDLVTGATDLKYLHAKERLLKIEADLRNFDKREEGNQSAQRKFETRIFGILDWCKENKFLEYDYHIENIEDAQMIIEEVIGNTKEIANNSKQFAEIDELYKLRNSLQIEIAGINQYQTEFDNYKRNLEKSADSLIPIEFLRKNLSDQIVDSYETKLFIESLENSLEKIKTNLAKKRKIPVQVKGDLKALKDRLVEVEKKIKLLNEVNKNYSLQAERFIALGKIKYAYEELVRQHKLKPLDSTIKKRLNEEKEELEKLQETKIRGKYLVGEYLNGCIQRNYDQLESLPSYKGFMTKFRGDEMILRLVPPNELFPLDNVGSKSNYMFMHLCFYLGLHEHMINFNQNHVPRFLFIDQPSIPYYSGENDDKAKLVDAFTLLNSFIEYINIQKKSHFQIFMVEHASKEYWIENNLIQFHLVEEFIEGNGLIPKNVYNS
ncbi:MAG: DUF3732 domain-containing protein [Bacteroidia bacterium]|nr:DUF3732 domain-containing protein [Bacteroidia bacterium]